MLLGVGKWLKGYTLEGTESILISRSLGRGLEKSFLAQHIILEKFDRKDKRVKKLRVTSRTDDYIDMIFCRGVTHNIPLLRDVLTEPVFLSGTFTTSYLPQTYPDGFQGTQLQKGEILTEVEIFAA